jgi:mono/diheme cytochrome c family protein
MEAQVSRILAIAAALAFGAWAQEKSPASVWDGIYTDAQASRGQAGYGKNCASCHGEKLEGQGQAPPLAGADFLSNWNGMSVGDLFDQIQATMPADRPGQLSKPDNADILAYILKMNHFPTGPKELPADPEALKKIRVEAAKPQN